MIISLVFLLLQIQVIDSGPEHYSVISTHNLFRPLGWTSPVDAPKWRLIGIANDKAYFVSVKSFRISVLSRGGTLGNNKVIQISDRKVTLEGGDVYTTKSVEFLGNEKGRSRRSSRGSTRRGGGSEGKVSEGDRSKRRVNASTRTTGRNFQRSVSETQRQEWREARKKFQNASSEERLRMIEKYMDRRGGRQ